MTMTTTQWKHPHNSDVDHEWCTKCVRRGASVPSERLARLHHEGGWAAGGCTLRTSKVDEPGTEIEWYMCPKSTQHRSFGDWMSQALGEGR